MRRPLRWFVAGLVLARAVKPRRDDRPPRERIIPAEAPSPRAELVVVGLLLAAAAAAAFAVVAYAAQWSTQAFGGPLAGALALLAAAMIVTAEHLIVTEHLEEEYPPDEHPEAEDDLSALLRESGDRITRKKLLGGAAAVAGTTMGAALVAPALSMGPALNTSLLNDSPWHRGRALVDEFGKPLSADDIEQGPFYTAFPQGAERMKISSPLILIKLEQSLIRDRRAWAPEGILAFSKICTHAGCAIALYRNPKFDRTQPGHALVCPCHYSTFDPAQAGKVLFGPAGRPLPQLPLQIAPDRTLRAAGALSGPPGPSWWGVRRP
jgi:ubiquinol-cytochrome c reductase iron-sulfur subunit